MRKFLIALILILCLSFSFQKVSSISYKANLEAYLRFNTGSGTQVFDSSPNPRVVTESGMDGSEWITPSYRTPANYCLDIDTHGINVAMDGEDLDAHGWSIGCWIKMDSPTWHRGFWHFYDTTASQFAMAFGYDFLQNYFYLTTQVSGGSKYWYSSTDPIVYTDWNFIVITWSGDPNNHTKLYINGSYTQWNTLPSIPYTVLYDVDDFRLNDPTYNYEGLIDDVFVYSTEISADRIDWLYNNMPDRWLEPPEEATDETDIPDFPVDEGHEYDRVLVVGDIGFSPFEVVLIMGFVATGSVLSYLVFAEYRKWRR